MKSPVQDRLQQAQDTIDIMQQRHDESQQQSNTIVMQLTQQLEQKTLALEDMRNRSVWRRVKTALGFSVT